MGSTLEVLIVGAGPTGLFLGLELKKRGISVRLIDQREGPSIHSKAMGIQARTLEFFDKLGIVSSFLERGRLCDQIHSHWNHKTLKLSFGALPTPFPFLMILSQAETENILLEEFKKMGGTVEWNTRLLDVSQKEALIELPTNERTSCSFEWLVGCDGAHSTTRHALNLSFKGALFPETFFLADIKATSPSKIDSPHIFFGKKGLGFFLPFSTPNLYRVIFPLSKKLDTTPTADMIASWMQERGYRDPFEVTHIEWLSEFQIHRRHVPTMRQGTILLAGDAAHIHSPAGGQGMNTSIQDAANLAWKLELVIKKCASETLLDTYTEERLPIAKQVLKFTSGFTYFVTFCQKVFPPLFFLPLWLLNTFPKLRAKAFYGMSELGISYPNSSLTQEDSNSPKWKGPKAGMRAPDCLLKNGIQLFEFLRSPRFVLLLFNDKSPLVDSVRARFGQWIDIIYLEGDEVKKIYAATSDSIYIIRPDGYIGFRRLSPHTGDVINYLETIFL